VQVPAALRLVSGLSLSFSPRVEGMPQAIRAFLPVVGARGVVNLSGWLDYALAAFLATGAVAALGYAQTLYLLPISLFGMSIAASQLPEMSRRSVDAVLPQAEIESGLDRVRFFLIPSAWVFSLLGDVVVAALYQTGSFGRPEVLLTWSVLAAYALGLTASGGSRLLSSAFYALRDPRTPARIAGLRVAVSLVVGGLLMFPLDRLEVASDLRLGAVGLALGASVGAWAEFVLLRRSLRPRLAASAPGPRSSAWLRQMLAGGLAGGLALSVRTWMIPALPPVVEAVAVLGVFGGVYLLSARVLGLELPLPSGLRLGRGGRGAGS
jgi:putative peptidoglycan lipid II flippase